MIKHTLFVILLFLLMSAITTNFINAEDTKPQEQFVYQMYLSDGNNVVDNFIPQSENTIYMLAEKNNALSPRITLVQWWPISKQYVAVFQKLNEEVPGTLEILKNGDVLTKREENEYLLFYPNGIAAAHGEMRVGKEAYETLKTYKAPLLKYYEKFDEYNLKVVEFQNSFTAYAEEINKKRKAGIVINPDEIRATMPKPPQPPEPPGFDITGMRKDFIVNLPKGSYTIRLRAKDGTIVEGSEKNLVAFTPRRTGGIGYEIIPKNRWTKKESSDDSSRIIYAKNENTLYLRGFHEDEYNERNYMKLQNPQNQGSPQRWIWVHGRPIKDAHLAIISKEGDTKKIERASYYVKQIPGPTLGYEIIPAHEQENPDKKIPSFDGHMVRILSESAGGELSFWLEGGDGKPLKGSKRKVIELREANAVYLYGIAFFPLLLGGIISLRRRRV